MSDFEWYVKRLRPGARLPERAHDDDAGWDLFHCAPAGQEDEEPRLRSAGDLHLVELPTGLAMAFTPGWVFRIDARSGLARTHGVHVLGGVVDAGYRGEVVVLLRVPVVAGEDGRPRAAVSLRHGTKIAQGLFLPVPRVAPVERDELPGSLRGERGWGSTGA